MVVADDDVREWGKQNWEEKSADYAEMGYVPVSMKNDFLEIYPDPIKRADIQYVEPAGAPDTGAGDSLNQDDAAYTGTSDAADTEISDDAADTDSSETQDQELDNAA